MLVGPFKQPFLLQQSIQRFGEMGVMWNPDMVDMGVMWNPDMVDMGVMWNLDIVDMGVMWNPDMVDMGVMRFGDMGVMWNPDMVERTRSEKPPNLCSRRTFLLHSLDCVNLRRRRYTTERSA
jgi:hypothetical protein